jgi:hypothetical protein
MKKLIALTIALMLLTTGAFAALTADEAVSLQLIEGNLEISSDSDFVFADVNIADLPETVAPTSVPSFTLTDFSGNGLGWNVTVACPALVGGRGTDELDMTMEQAVGQGLLSDIAGQTLAAAGPEQVAITKKVVAADKAITAAAAAGMGSYGYAPAKSQFEVVIPVGSYAGVYDSTFTATIASGP